MSFDTFRSTGFIPTIDAYLLALAAANGGRFVTFDRGVPLDAARQAGDENLIVL